MLSWVVSMNIGTLPVTTVMIVGIEMAAYKEHCAHQKTRANNSFRWIKRQYNRLMRRMAKRDPEGAWRKRFFWGYYS